MSLIYPLSILLVLLVYVWKWNEACPVSFQPSPPPAPKILSGGKSQLHLWWWELFMSPNCIIVQLVLCLELYTAIDGINSSFFHLINQERQKLETNYISSNWSHHVLRIFKEIMSACTWLHCELEQMPNNLKKTKNKSICEQSLQNRWSTKRNTCQYVERYQDDQRRNVIMLKLLHIFIFPSKSKAWNSGRKQQ